MNDSRAVNNPNELNQIHSLSTGSNEKQNPFNSSNEAHMSRARSISPAARSSSQRPISAQTLSSPAVSLRCSRRSSRCLLQLLLLGAPVDVLWSGRRVVLIDKLLEDLARLVKLVETVLEHADLLVLVEERLPLLQLVVLTQAALK